MHKKLLWTRIIITCLVIILYILYYKFKFIIDGITLIPIILVIFLWLGDLKSIEIPGIIKIKRDFLDSIAHKSVKPPSKFSNSDTIIDFGKYHIIKLQSSYKPTRFSFKARIHYDHEAGSAFLLKIVINDVLIDEARLLNKPQIKEYKDNRKSNWFSEKDGAWSLQYSPDFKINYEHKVYKVINGDPYLFIFNIKDIMPMNKDYIIKFIHVGDDAIQAHKNVIICSEIKLE